MSIISACCTLWMRHMSLNNRRRAEEEALEAARQEAQESPANAHPA